MYSIYIYISKRYVLAKGDGPHTVVAKMGFRVIKSVVNWIGAMAGSAFWSLLYIISDVFWCGSCGVCMVFKAIADGIAAIHQALIGSPINRRPINRMFTFGDSPSTP